MPLFSPRNVWWLGSQGLLDVFLCWKFSGVVLSLKGTGGFMFACFFFQPPPIDIRNQVPGLPETNSKFAPENRPNFSQGSTDRLPWPPFFRGELAVSFKKPDFDFRQRFKEL